MRDSLRYPFVSTRQKHHNLLSECSSSICISSPFLLLIFAPFAVFRARLREDRNSKFEIRESRLRDPGKLRIGTPSLRAVLGCMKHPPNPEFVVQCSVNTMERLFQWVCDFSFLREFFEKSLQVLERPSAQVKTNRIAANASLVEPQPVRRRNLYPPAFQSCIEGFLLLNRRHVVLRRRILHFH